MSDVPLITGTSSLDLLTEAGLDATAALSEGNRPMFWQQIERVRAALAICDSLSPLRMARVTLTNAQIKALPTTAGSLVSALGSGVSIQPIWARVMIDASAGAYTNINAAATVAIQHNGSTAGLLSYIPNDGSITNSSTTRVTDLFGAASKKHAILVPFQDTEGVDENGPIPNVHLTSLGENKALELQFDNGGSGNLTGGNAANAGQVDILYLRL